MRIAITGSTGFVGAALIRFFSGKEHEVIAYGRQKTPPKRLSQYANYISQDLTKAIAEIDAEVLIHAAGLASDTADYNALYENNVTATQFLMEAAKKCRQIIFISSSSV